MPGKGGEIIRYFGYKRGGKETLPKGREAYRLLRKKGDTFFSGTESTDFGLSVDRRRKGLKTSYFVSIVDMTTGDKKPGNEALQFSGINKRGAARRAARSVERDSLGFPAFRLPRGPVGFPEGVTE